MINRKLANGTTIQIFEADATYGMGGKVRRHTMLGGYPLFYLDAGDNCLCASCVDEVIADHDSPEGGLDTRDLPVSANVNWESLLFCDQCSNTIDSAYTVIESE